MDGCVDGCMYGLNYNSISEKKKYVKTNKSIEQSPT